MENMVKYKMMIILKRGWIYDKYLITRQKILKLY